MPEVIPPVAETKEPYKTDFLPFFARGFSHEDIAEHSRQNNYTLTLLPEDKSYDKYSRQGGLLEGIPKDKFHDIYDKAKQSYDGFATTQYNGKIAPFWQYDKPESKQPDYDSGVTGGIPEGVDKYGRMIATPDQLAAMKGYTIDTDGKRIPYEAPGMLQKLANIPIGIASALIPALAPLVQGDDPSKVRIIDHNEYGEAFYRNVAADDPKVLRSQIASSWGPQPMTENWMSALMKGAYNGIVGVESMVGSVMEQTNKFVDFMTTGKDSNSWLEREGRVFQNLGQRSKIPLGEEASGSMFSSFSAAAYSIGSLIPIVLLTRGAGGAMEAFGVPEAAAHGAGTFALFTGMGMDSYTEAGKENGVDPADLAWQVMLAGPAFGATAFVTGPTFLTKGLGMAELKSGMVKALSTEMKEYGLKHGTDFALLSPELKLRFVKNIGTPMGKVLLGAHGMGTMMAAGEATNVGVQTLNDWRALVNNPNAAPGKGQFEKYDTNKSFMSNVMDRLPNKMLSSYVSGFFSGLLYAPVEGAARKGLEAIRGKPFNSPGLFSAVPDMVNTNIVASGKTKEAVIVGEKLRKDSFFGRTTHDSEGNVMTEGSEGMTENDARHKAWLDELLYTQQVADTYANKSVMEAFGGNIGLMREVISYGKDIDKYNEQLKTETDPEKIKEINSNLDAAKQRIKDITTKEDGTDFSKAYNDMVKSNHIAMYSIRNQTDEDYKTSNSGAEVTAEDRKSQQWTDMFEKNLKNDDLKKSYEQSKVFSTDVDKEITRREGHNTRVKSEAEATAPVVQQIRDEITNVGKLTDDTERLSGIRRITGMINDVSTKIDMSRQLDVQKEFLNLTGTLATEAQGRGTENPADVGYSVGLTEALRGHENLFTNKQDILPTERSKVISDLLSGDIARQVTSSDPLSVMSMTLNDSSDPHATQKKIKELKDRVENNKRVVTSAFILGRDKEVKSHITKNDITLSQAETEKQAFTLDVLSASLRQAERYNDMRINNVPDKYYVHHIANGRRSLENIASAVVGAMPNFNDLVDAIPVIPEEWKELEYTLTADERKLLNQANRQIVDIKSQLFDLRDKIIDAPEFDSFITDLVKYRNLTGPQDTYLGTQFYDNGEYKTSLDALYQFKPEDDYWTRKGSVDVGYLNTINTLIETFGVHSCSIELARLKAIQAGGDISDPATQQAENLAFSFMMNDGGNAHKILGKVLQAEAKQLLEAKSYTPAEKKLIENEIAALNRRFMDNAIFIGGDSGTGKSTKFLKGLYDLHKYYGEEFKKDVVVLGVSDKNNDTIHTGLSGIKADYYKLEDIFKDPSVIERIKNADHIIIDEAQRLSDSDIKLLKDHFTNGTIIFLGDVRQGEGNVSMAGVKTIPLTERINNNNPLVNVLHDVFRGVGNKMPGGWVNDAGEGIYYHPTKEGVIAAFYADASTDKALILSALDYDNLTEEEKKNPNIFVLDKDIDNTSDYPRNVRGSIFKKVYIGFERTGDDSDYYTATGRATDFIAMPDKNADNLNKERKEDVSWINRPGAIPQEILDMFKNRELDRLGTITGQQVNTTKINEPTKTKTDPDAIFPVDTIPMEGDIFKQKGKGYVRIVSIGKDGALKVVRGDTVEGLQNLNIDEPGLKTETVDVADISYLDEQHKKKYQPKPTIFGKKESSFEQTGMSWAYTDNTFGEKITPEEHATKQAITNTLHQLSPYFNTELTYHRSQEMMDGTGKQKKVNDVLAVRFTFHGTADKTKFLDELRRAVSKDKLSDKEFEVISNSVKETGELPEKYRYLMMLDAPNAQLSDIHNAKLKKLINDGKSANSIGPVSLGWVELGDDYGAKAYYEKGADGKYKTIPLSEFVSKVTGKVTLGKSLRAIKVMEKGNERQKLVIYHDPLFVDPNSSYTIVRTLKLGEAGAKMKEGGTAADVIKSWQSEGIAKLVDYINNNRVQWNKPTLKDVFGSYGKFKPTSEGSKFILNKEFDNPEGHKAFFEHMISKADIIKDTELPFKTFYGLDDLLEGDEANNFVTNTLDLSPFTHVNLRDIDTSAEAPAPKVKPKSGAKTIVDMAEHIENTKKSEADPEWKPQPIGKKTTLYRSGEIVGDAAHFATSTDNFIAGDSNNTDRYELSPDAKIADVSDKAVLDRIKVEAIKNAKTPEEKAFIESWDPQGELRLDWEKAKPIYDAAKSLGYDGMTQFDITDGDTPTAINLWDISKTKMIEGEPPDEQNVINEQNEFDGLLSGNAQQNRDAGSYVKDGITYTRNGVLNTVNGSSGTVKFTDKMEVPFEYSLVEANELQPAHIQGKRNPLYFLPEAQPKNRTDASSMMQSDNIAANPKLKEVGENSLAYSGAPIINERGEVIQGNNRSEGLKKHYQGGGTDYKDQLAKSADKFGLTADQVNGMKEPVLVRKIKVDDRQAIELGNYDVKDIETGGKRRIDPVATVRRIPREIKAKITDILFQDNPDNTLNAAIREKSSSIIGVLKDYLTNTQIESLVNVSGELKPEGLRDIETLVSHFLFDGGDIALPEMFENLSVFAREGLIKSIPKIFSVSTDKSILRDVQNAVLVVNNFKSSGVDDFGKWRNQIDMFAGDKTPDEIYNPIEMMLAEKLIKAQTQKEIKTIFSQYHEYVNGKEGDMFGGEVPPMSKGEAIEKQFNIKYNDRKNEDQNQGGQTPPDEVKRNEPARFADNKRVSLETLNTWLSSNVAPDVAGDLMESLKKSGIGFLTVDGKRVFGYLMNGKIRMELSKDGVVYSTPKHEFFHMVYNYFLDEKSKDIILSEAKTAMKRYSPEWRGKKVTDLQAEEWIADYMGKTGIEKPFEKRQESPWYTPKGILQTFMDLIDKMFGNYQPHMKEIDNLLYRIDHGRFKDQVPYLKDEGQPRRTQLDMNRDVNKVIDALDNHAGKSNLPQGDGYYDLFLDRFFKKSNGKNAVEFGGKKHSLYSAKDRQQYAEDFTEYQKWLQGIADMPYNEAVGELEKAGITNTKEFYDGITDNLFLRNYVDNSLKGELTDSKIALFQGEFKRLPEDLQKQYANQILITNGLKYKPGSAIDVLPKEFYEKPGGLNEQAKGFNRYLDGLSNDKAELGRINSELESYQGTGGYRRYPLGGFESEKTAPDGIKSNTSNTPTELKQAPEPEKIAKIVDKRVNQKAFDILFDKIQSQFPDLNFIKENGDTLAAKGMDPSLRGYVDSQGVHYNIDRVTLTSGVHEMQHVWNMVYANEHPEQWGDFKDYVRNSISQGGNDISKLAEEIKYKYPELNDDQFIDEMMATIGGFTSIPAVERFLRDSDSKIAETDKTFANRIYEGVKRFVTDLWTGLKGIFGLKDGFKIDNPDLEQFYKDFTDQIFHGDKFKFSDEEMKTISRMGKAEQRSEKIGDLSDITLNLASEHKDSMKFSKMTPEEVTDKIYNEVKKTGINTQGNYYYHDGSMYHPFDSKVYDTDEKLKEAIENQIAPRYPMIDSKVPELIKEYISFSSGPLGVAATFNSKQKTIADLAVHVGLKDYSQHTLKALVGLLGIEQGAMDVVRYSELSAHKDERIRNLYKEDMSGYDPIVVIHGFDKNGIADVSLFDITSYGQGTDVVTGKDRNILADIIDDKQYHKLGGPAEYNDRMYSYRKLLLGMQALGMDAKFRKISVIETRKDSVKPYQVNNIEDVQKILDIMKGLPEFMAGIQSNNIKGIINGKRITSNEVRVPFVDQLNSYLSTVEASMAPYDKYDAKRESIAARRNMLTDPNVSRLEKIRALTNWQRDLERKIGKAEMYSDPVYQMVSLTLDEMRRPTTHYGMILNANDIGEIRGGALKLLTPAYVQHSSFIQASGEAMARSIEMTVGRYEEYHQKVLPLLKKVAGKWQMAHPGDAAKSLGKDAGNLFFDHLFKTIEVVAGKDLEYGGKKYKKGDKVTVKSPILHTDKNDPDTKSLYANGKINDDDLALNNLMMDEMKQRTIDNIYWEHIFSASDGHVDDMEKKPYSREEAVQQFEDMNKRTAKGHVPTIERSVSDLLTSGKWKAGFSKYAENTKNPEEIFQDINSDPTAVRLFQSINEQMLDPSKTYEKMGMVEVKDGSTSHWELMDSDANEKASHNIESIGNYFMLKGIRDEMIGREFLPEYNTQMALMQAWETASGHELPITRDFLSQYFDRYVNRKNADEKMNSGTITLPGGHEVPVSTVARTAMIGMKDALLFLRVVTFLKVGIAGEFKATLNAIANSAANMGLPKEMQDELLPTLTDHMYSAYNMFAEKSKVLAIAREFHFWNQTENSLLQAPTKNVAKGKNLTSQGIGLMPESIIDQSMRIHSLMSMMVHNGSWKAYSVDSKTGELKWDRMKDKRYFNPDGTQTAKQRASYNGLIERLKTQGEMEEGETVPSKGDDWDIIGNQYKWYANQFVYVGIDDATKGLITNSWYGSLVAMFRNFLAPHLYNMGVNAKTGETIGGGRYVPYVDENGNETTVLEKRIMEGQYQSWKHAVEELVQVKNMKDPVGWWKGLPQVRRVNLIRSLLYAGSLAGLAFFIHSISKEDEKRFSYLYSELMLGYSSEEWMKNPIPMLGTTLTLTQVALGQKDFSVLASMPGIPGGIRRVKSLIGK